ncbi:response regulator transcription factor [Oscillatoria amoena NRMC-F 0135]|nr:response regulator transcription factor [Oscillatoria amoena NRMC-F 0135]
MIADDHQLFLDGIISLLATENHFLIETAHNGNDVLKKTGEDVFDICLLDIGMPGLDGIATARELKARSDIKIIILTTYNDKEIIEEMIRTGVAGYLLKNCTRNELIKAIETVLAGGRYYSDEVKGTIITEYTSYLKGRTIPEKLLTPREIEILKLLAKEYTNEKIAKALNISFRTVETHRKNIMQKTKSHNLAGLLNYAHQNHLLK